MAKFRGGEMVGTESGALTVQAQGHKRLAEGQTQEWEPE